MSRIADLSAADRHEVTCMLDAWSGGDEGALDRLTPLVLDDLRRLARGYMARQAPGHTLQPTALVNEAYMRLIGHRRKGWENREHFFAYLATTMRRLLVNHARGRAASKRGGGALHVELDDGCDLPVRDAAARGGRGEATRQVEILALDEALASLAAIDPRQARIVELRYFGGLSVEETARALDVSARTVKRDWHTARLFLLRALGPVH